MASDRNSVDANFCLRPGKDASSRSDANRSSRLRWFAVLAFTLSSVLLSGCHIERIVLEEPVRDQLVEVDTEDHIVVRLNENETTGYKWTAKCSNPLVDVTLEHEAADDDDLVAGESGLATVHLRVRRGFIGPAVVYMRYEHRWSDDCVRKVKLQLYRRQTNVAGWR